eukprot:TRINITY_DN29793_c1_g2_i1.p3 TRINITY_DN29793_c1_g2~~TRINITY_DN29793_c1_g2_i1.p3  ORF type:complete len:109 (+),score=7.92 TRINITY_DN29793_c1_g2_i1:246-572(+)
MGCFTSKPEEAYYPDENQYVSVENASTNLAESFGLEHTHEVIRLLGSGGTGDTWLCRSLKTKQYEAVKLIKRPIPKVIIPMVLEEIKIQGDLGEGHLNIINAHECYLI